MATERIEATFTNKGVAATGLGPNWPKLTVQEDDGSVVVNAQVMTEVGNGHYYHDFATYDPTKHYYYYADGGPTLTKYDQTKYGTNHVGFRIDTSESNIRGADDDTLKTVSDQIDPIGNKLPTNNIMGSSDKDDHDGEIGDILVDTNEMQGKLPTNNIMGSSDKADHDGQIGNILTDTNEMQGKLPTNNIMGSSDKADHDGQIANILADTNETQTKLPTNNIMGSGVKSDKDDEIDAIATAVPLIPAAVDTLLSTNHGAGSWLTATSTAIADAVWKAAISGYLTAGQAGWFLAVALGVPQRNVVLDGGVGKAEATYDTNGFMTSGRLRVFDTATNAGNATLGGAAGQTGELESVAITGIPHSVFVKFPGAYRTEGQ